MLLSVVVGSTSFEYIYTINKITYYSFKEACIALNLLQEDEDDDILFQTCCDTENMTLELRNTNIQNRALLHLQSILSKYKRCLEEFLYMPIPIADTNTEQNNHLIREKQQYNIKELVKIIKKELLCLNVDQ
ncbi:20906_t:CDS:2 [Cetraspora pellucida]|uniref:20906_t:CDS:1 n=1 Tax=Cetraspora pellucida TaxID=1433469 RepID=A0A9N9JKA9_9GLOM|nr:20906_t:CDS:2 [Cetraspora pellucida]